MFRYLRDSSISNEDRDRNFSRQIFLIVKKKEIRTMRNSALDRASSLNPVIGTLAYPIRARRIRQNDREMPRSRDFSNDSFGRMRRGDRTHTETRAYTDAGREKMCTCFLYAGSAITSLWIYGCLTKCYFDVCRAACT